MKKSYSKNKKKKVDLPKFAWGGKAFHQETPNEAMARFNKNALLASVEAQQAAAPWEMAAGLAFNVGTKLLGGAIQDAGGLGKILGKGDNISGVGKGLDSLFGFKTGEADSFGEIKNVLPGAEVEKIPQFSSEDFMKGLEEARNFTKNKSWFGNKFFATGGRVNSNIPIEAEGGEIVETPQGGLEELFGPSHEQGGIPLQVPQGTEIFSDRLVGVDGNTMATRKKLREIKEQKIQKKLDKNPGDILLKKTLQRIKSQNEIQEQKDLQIMESIKQAQQPTEEYALGGLVNPIPFLGGLFNPKVFNITGTSDDFHNGWLGTQGINPNEPLKVGYNTDIKEVELTGKRKSKIESIPTKKLDIDTTKYNNIVIPNIINNTPNVIPQVTTEDSKNTIDWSNIGETLNKSNPLNGATIGDIFGLYNNYRASKELRENTIRNMEMTPEERNYYDTYGRDTLSRIKDKYGLLEGIKDQTLLDLQLNRNSTISRNNNGARGINTQRALNLAIDAQTDKATREVYNNYLIQKMGILDQEISMMDTIDKAYRLGEEQRDDRHLKNIDTFFSDMAQNISTRHNADNALVKAMNHRQLENIYKDLYGKTKNYEYSRVNGVDYIKTPQGTFALTHEGPKKVTAKEEEELGNIMRAKVVEINKTADTTTDIQDISKLKDKAEIKKIQQILVDNGFKIKVDGIIGPKTKKAWEEYLKKSTGEVSTGSTSPSTISINKSSYDKNSYGKEFKNRSSIENANKRLGLGESNNTYNIENKEGSSAKGKYQYLWKWHGDSIMKMFPQIKSDKDFLNNPEVQEKYHQAKMKENLSFAKANLKTARKHHPNISIEDLMMLHHYQPEMAKKFVKGKIDLNYVPAGGSKDYSNSSIGVYLYGNSFPGVKRWNTRTQKYE